MRARIHLELFLKYGKVFAICSAVSPIRNPVEYSATAGATGEGHEIVIGLKSLISDLMIWPY